MPTVNWQDPLFHAERTHCTNGHELTPGNSRVRTTSKGYTIIGCRECVRRKNIANKKSRDKKQKQAKRDARADALGASPWDVLDIVEPPR